MSTIKISQLPAKGANLEATDLVEISEFNGSGYVSKSITGQEIIDGASGGGVTDVTGTDPIVSTGGSTPDISIRQSGSIDDGYLSSSDWNTFNNKQDTLVSGTNIKSLNGTSLLGSGGLSVQPTLVSGTNIKTINSTSILGSGDIDVQDTLVSGTNIKTINGNSVLGSGDITINGGIVGVHSLLFIPGASVTNQMMTSSATLSGALLTANTIIAAPFIPAQNITTSNLFMQVSTLFAGALCRIAIYSNVNSQPSSLLYVSSDLSMSSIGIKTAVTTFNFIAGTTYWLAIHGGTTGTSGVNAISSTNLIPIKASGAASSSFSVVTASSTFTSGTPSTFPSPTFANSNMPYIGITKA